MEPNTIQALVIEAVMKLSFISPVITGMNMAIKKTGFPVRYLPLLSMVLGIAGTLLLGGLSAAGVIAGLVIGLSAVGLYEFTSTTVGGNREA